MKRKNFLWSERDDKAITQAAEALGTSVTQYILLACHEKMKREKDADALADIRGMLDTLRTQSEAEARGLTHVLSQNAEEEMRRFKHALAKELDEHLRIIVDTLTRFGRTGVVPKPKGAGSDLENL